jgi:queuine tRNA-ribosyltransferase
VSAIATRHGELRAPSFLPDATRAVVRTLDAQDLESVGIRGVMVNAFHLSTHPGVRRVQHLGGVHRFMGWTGPVVVDSGGFQVFSLIRQNPGHGTIRDREVLFRGADGRRQRWTPEKTIQHQFQLGADVMIALDDCTDTRESPDEQKRAVERTIAWTRRAREEFDRQIDGRRIEGPRPLLIGVIQGGSDLALRADCARALQDIGVDGFGYGGWPVDAEGALQLEVWELLARILPATAPRFALGVGKPEHLTAIAALPGAYHFDCSLPTRDARHHRLYRFTELPEPGTRQRFYEHVHILDAEYGSQADPIDATCDCLACRRYGAGYVHHLFKVNDSAGARLATLHNLRFYTRLIERLAAAPPAQPAGEADVSR